MINATSQRVRLNTADHVNEELSREAERRVTYYASHRDQIDQRLKELDQEWDIERAIEVEGPVTTLSGMLLGILFGRKWLVLPLFAQTMVALHALQGWYPLLPVFRRMGFRTKKEISAERNGLRALRGDFEQTADASDSPTRAARAFDAAKL